MKIYDLFEKNIDREISGVVKVGDTDATKAWTILEEYVVTKELSQLFSTFFSAYNESLNKPTDKMGVWISGFYGSGKSHFLLILSHLLANRPVSSPYATEQRRPLQFFEEKGLDSFLIAEMGRATSVPTETVIFNIDAKAEQRDNEFAVLNVFLRVFNALQGFYEKTPWIAEFERRLVNEGVYETFEREFEVASGKPWRSNRDAIVAKKKHVITALTKSLPGTSSDDATEWFEDLKGNYSASPETFAKLVKQYLDSKGPKARIVFLVDEVSQFISERAEVMLKLQTITEELGTHCKGRAWVVVTAQEDIDIFLDNINRQRASDVFSKIQGRFNTRLSLSSTNVDEVIKLRILKKTEAAHKNLSSLYGEREPIIKNLLSFSAEGTQMPTYQGEADFALTYPFVPYQFHLLQKVYAMIRRTGASGQNLAHGERSMIDAFQSAAQTFAAADVGTLVPFYQFYDSIENSLEGVIKSAISRATADHSLNGELDAKVLKLLFLLRNLDAEVPSTIDNLATLCVDDLDADKLKIKKGLEGSLSRLEERKVIRRNDDRYSFLSDLEQEIEREIGRTDVDATRQIKKLFSLIFEDILKVKGAYNYKPLNRTYTVTRQCDSFIADRQTSELTFAVVSPLWDRYQEFCQFPEIHSGTFPTTAFLLLSWDDSFQREFDIWLKTDRYADMPRPSHSPEREKIVTQIIQLNGIRRERLEKMLETILNTSRLFIAGTEQQRRLAPASFKEIFGEAVARLIGRTYDKIGLIEVSTEHFDRDLRLILTESDTSKFIQDTIPFKEATDIVRTFIFNSQGKLLDLTDVIARHEKSPYGWKDEDIVLIIARLFRRGDIELTTDAPLTPSGAYPLLQRSASWRGIRVARKQKVSAEVLSAAQSHARQWFAITPQDDENLFVQQVRKKLADLKSDLKEKETEGEKKGYPGQAVISGGTALVSDLLNRVESSHLLTAMTESSEEIKRFIDSFEDIRDFYKYQRPKWTVLTDILEQAGRNELHLRGVEEVQAVLHKVRSIVEHPHPFSLLKETDRLEEKFRATLDELQSQFRLSAENGISDSLRRLEAVYHEHQHHLDEDFEHFTAPFEELRQDIQKETILSNIQFLGSKASTLAESQAQEIRRRINAKAGATEEVAVAVAPSAQRVKLARFQELGKPLTTLDEVRAFIDKAEGALKEAVQKGPIFVE